MRFYEVYIERLKQSLAQGPMGDRAVGLISLFDSFPTTERFQMVQELQRLLDSVDPAEIDFDRTLAVVKQALAGARDAAGFKANLWKIVQDAKQGGARS